MKKLLLFVGFVLGLGTTLVAQDCATGYCPTTIIAHHKEGVVAPITADITYGVISSAMSGATKCWITQNLGASTQAGSATDAMDASAGWYFQFNRSQGYSMSGTTRTPATSWITTISESSDWVAANDPCTLLLGSTWRLPTQSEWASVVTNASITNYTTAYNSALKLHAPGYLNYNNGALNSRGVIGYYWSSKQNTINNGYDFYINSGASNGADVSNKAYGWSVRCIRSY